MPRQPLTMHRHDNARVLVALRGGHTITWETGNAYWLPADPPGELHGDANESDAAIEVIVIELKKSGP